MVGEPDTAVDVWQDFQFEFYSQRLKKDQGEVAPQDISQTVSMGSNMVFLLNHGLSFFSLGGLLFWEVSVVPVEGRDFFVKNSRMLWGPCTI